MRFILAACGVVVLLGTSLAAQQVSTPVVQPGSPHDAHAHTEVAGDESSPPSPSGALGHAFTLNLYVSDSGVEPSIVFVPAGRRVQLVLRNTSMAEHHYRVVGMVARDLLWLSEPGGASDPFAENPDDDHMHHARDFVASRAASPAGIRPTGREVHVYVSAAQLVDIVIFTATQTGSFVVRCDLHQEIVGKMVVFDVGDTSAAPDNPPAETTASPPVNPSTFQQPNTLRLQMTRDLGDVDHPGASPVRVEATYAPADQLTQILGGPAPTMPELDADRYLAILLTETVHQGDLPGTPETPHLYVGESHLPLIDSKIVTQTPQQRMTLYRFGRDSAFGQAERIMTLRLASGREATWELPLPASWHWLGWLSVAGILGLVGWLAWTLRQDTARRSNNFRWARAGGLIFLGFVAAWSWLFIVSRWGPEKRTDILTFKAGVTSNVMRALMKSAEGTGPHNHDATGITGVYATPEYFLMTEQTQEADKYQPEKFNVFYVFEDSHNTLPLSPPEMTLRLANGRQFSPVDAAVLTQSDHHRATAVRFPSQDAEGQSLINDDASFFELVAAESSSEQVGRLQNVAITGGTPMMAAAQVMRWDLPILYPKDLQGNDLSLPTLLALLAGLLAVLSPCLLQLTVYYTFALTGMNVQPTPAGMLEARSQVIRTALYFIAGFTVVFTAAGSLAGLVGQRLQSSGIMENWSRPLAVAAGLGILILGVWVGANAGAPGLCRLPLGGMLRSRGGWLDKLKVMFMGSAFAIGCSTCFGGALFISLMIYVGVAGSPAVGAAALFLFSLGIAIPYLLAAFFLSRALPLLNSLHKATPVVGLVCSVVLMVFGIILITDHFHVPSNLLYRLYLGL